MLKNVIGHNDNISTRRRPTSPLQLVFQYVGNNFQCYLACTVKHVYSDHAYNEMTLITKRLGIPGKILYF